MAMKQKFEFGELLKKQMELDKFIEKKKRIYSSPDELNLAILSELEELLRLLQWKWWANYDEKWSERREEMKQEIIDVLHFCLSGTATINHIVAHNVYIYRINKIRENYRDKDFETALKRLINRIGLFAFKNNYKNALSEIAVFWDMFFQDSDMNIYYLEKWEENFARQREGGRYYAKG